MALAPGRSLWAVLEEVILNPLRHRYDFLGRREFSTFTFQCLYVASMVNFFYVPYSCSSTNGALFCNFLRFFCYLDHCLLCSLVGLFIALLFQLNQFFEEVSRKSIKNFLTVFTVT